MAEPRWSIRDLKQVITPDGYILIAYTDVPCHLYCRMTLEPPRIHKKPSYRRGLSIADDVRFCFTVFEDNEQTEAGDTTTHTFVKEPWPVCETRWFYFHGTIGGDESPSTTPFFEKHFEGVDMYVISLGKFTEEEILHGHVKLKEGAGVTITRDDANNALIISAAAAAYQGFGDHWNYHDPDGALAGSLQWKFDQVQFAISDTGHEARIYTDVMQAWGFRRPVACEIRRGRGAQGAGNPLVYTAIVATTADMRLNKSQQSIGWWSDDEGALRCWNGDGVGFKETIFPWGVAPPAWLKWVVSDTDIKFYANNTLVATHTTYLPIQTSDLFFAIQAYGTAYGPRTVYMTRPHYSAD
ncbi:hypothetical protein ES703_114384 [subsurface metagenome]